MAKARYLVEAHLLEGGSVSELAQRAEEAIIEWTDEPTRDDLCLLVMTMLIGQALAHRRRGVLEPC